MAMKYQINPDESFKIAFVLGYLLPTQKRSTGTEPLIFLQIDLLLSWMTRSSSKNQDTVDTLSGDIIAMQLKSSWRTDAQETEIAFLGDLPKQSLITIPLI